MKKRAERPRLVIETADGRQLDVVWSRSAKSVGVAITTALLRPYVQTGLERSQVDDFVSFLSDPDGRLVEFADPDGRGTMRAEWSSRRHRLRVTVSNDERAFKVELALTPDQARELGGFLRAAG